MTNDEPPAAARTDLDFRPSADETRPAPTGRPPDPVAVAQLWADQFRHLTTLGVAGAGGVLVMLESDLVAADGIWWRVLGLFVMTVVFSIYGQMAVVDLAGAGSPMGRKPGVLRGLAVASLGAAAGAAIAGLAGA